MTMIAARVHIVTLPARQYIYEVCILLKPGKILLHLVPYKILIFIAAEPYSSLATMSSDKIKSHPWKLHPRNNES